MTRTRIRALAALGALLLTASACGGTTNSASGNKDSVTVMVIGDLSSPVLSLPQLVTGAQAAVNEVNAQGGVNGRTVRLETCNAQADPNVAAQCARKAVTDKVSAVVGMLTIQSNSVQPILAQAKIPSIAGLDTSPLDHTSPNSFAVVSAAVEYLAQVLVVPGWEQCKKPAVLYSTVSGDPDYAKAIEKLYSQVSPPVNVKLVSITSNNTDASPQVTALLSGGTDCAFWLAPQPIALNAMKLVANSGQKLKIGVTGANLTPQSLQQLGDAASGVYIASAFKLPGATQEGDAFSKSMSAVDPKAVQDPNAESAYAAVHIFADATKSLTDYSAPSVSDALNQAKNLDVGTMSPIPSFPADGGIPGRPRVYEHSEFSYVFDGQNLHLTQQEPVDLMPWLTKVL